MKPIDFPQCNCKLAENQPEYETVPVFVQTKELPDADMQAFQNSGIRPKAIPWSMTACYELSDEEIAEITANKKIFYRQMLFGNNFQPMFISTKDPFIEANKEHWPAE